MCVCGGGMGFSGQRLGSPTWKALDILGLKWEAFGGHRTKESELPRYSVELEPTVKGLGERHFSCGKSLLFSHSPTPALSAAWASGPTLENELLREPWAFSRGVQLSAVGSKKCRGKTHMNGSVPAGIPWAHQHMYVCCTSIALCRQHAGFQHGHHIHHTSHTLSDVSLRATCMSHGHLVL